MAGERFVREGAMPTLKETVERIVALANANDPSAVGLSVGAADAYLASIHDPSHSGRWRAELIAELRRIGPQTRLMDQIIAAIEKGETPTK
jgi:hypothetical protein